MSVPDRAEPVASRAGLAEVTLITATLELRSPGGVTSPEQENPPKGVQLPLARHPFRPDEVCLPASSLAGSLRAHLTDVLGDRVTALMGDPPDTTKDRRAAGSSAGRSPSAVRFCGTRVDHARVARQRGTAIDRHRAAAGTNTLRVSEVLLPGSRITAFLRLDRPDLAGELLAALASWAPALGRGRTSGHGRTRLVSLRQRHIDLRTAVGRRAWLTEGGPDMFDDEHTEPVPITPPPDPEPLLVLGWQVVDGLRVGTGVKERRSGVGAQIAVLARDHAGVPYLPGSTWKGVLRSRCEFILRSLGAPACRPGPDPCGRCLICTGFGFTGSDEQASSRRGVLVFSDSAVDGAEVEVRTHAPQDRVFGGVRDSLLFTEEVVSTGRLTLTVHAAGPNPVPAPLVALLTLACHDIHHGRLGVGSATTRGLGTLRVAGDPTELTEQRAAAVSALTRHLATESAVGGPHE